MRQITIREVPLPGGQKGLHVDAGDLKPSDVLALLAEVLATLGKHVAAEYEAKRIEVASEVPA